MYRVSVPVESRPGCPVETNTLGRPLLLLRPPKHFVDLTWTRAGKHSLAINLKPCQTKSLCRINVDFVGNEKKDTFRRVASQIVRNVPHMLMQDSTVFRPRDLSVNLYMHFVQLYCSVYYFIHLTSPGRNFGI